MNKPMLLFTGASMLALYLMYSYNSKSDRTSGKNSRNPTKKIEAKKNIEPHTDFVEDLASHSSQRSNEVLKTPTSEDYNWGENKDEPEFQIYDPTAVNSGNTLDPEPSCSSWSVEALLNWSNSSPLEECTKDLSSGAPNNATGQNHLFIGKVRCKYWPDCKYEKSVFQLSEKIDVDSKKEYCNYWHPMIQCIQNNSCYYDNHCMFWHDKDFFLENRFYFKYKN